MGTRWTKPKRDSKAKFKVVLWIFPEVVLDDVSHAFHWLASISFVAGPWIPCPKRELGSPEVRTAYPLSCDKKGLGCCDDLVHHISQPAKRAT